MKKHDIKLSDNSYSFVLTIPATILTAIFIIVPIIQSLIMSFQKYGVKNIISGKPGTWNNLRNYIKLFEANQIPEAAYHTLWFVLFVIILQFIIGMALALVLNREFKGSRFIRSIMMTPWVVPTVISGLIWMWLFQPQYGFAKYFISIISFGNINDLAILNNPETALGGIAIAALWKQIPLTTLLLLAGLQNVPNSSLEAATIDGAGEVRKFVSIVLPYLSPVIKIAMSMSIIENFKQFPLFWTMTGGGPNGATTNFAILSYREAFVSMNLGSGAAVTTIWMLMMIIIVGIYQKSFKVQDMS
ncbi:MAG: sugar ABC transporter permease [Sphaerochaetaceae bacterium]|nr:sugar ABC transporter permease [Sphaerochaetaceae bacterium]MDC7237285.1 sugar ABC transporter permease [Sphaerochaetaceae bacterium]MDC7250617.1 sugar ABC transporter permease [Sphaerochaetaceae bacterium]